MKYKVGDKVKIKDSLELYTKYGAYSFVPEMDELKGIITTINKVGKNWYELKNATYWYWTDEMLEPAEFTKDDLKDGMLVVYRNGEKGIIIPTKECKMVAVEDGGFNYINHLTDDFKSQFEKSPYDVMAVYDILEYGNAEYFNPKKRELLWKYTPEKTKLSKSDIASICLELLPNL